MRGEQPLDIEVRKITDGLGFGDGGISAVAQEAKPGNENLAHMTDEAIHSPRILVPVDRDDNGNLLEDDGCGDGRRVLQTAGAVFSKVKQFARSLHRPKVFGGGAVMATAMRIGLGRAKGRTLNEAMSDGIDAMMDRQLDFGAHTDNHAHAPNCGCGAIDKAPLIVKAAVTYRSKIKESIAALGTSQEGLDDVLDEYAAYAAEIHGQDYSGRQTMDTIVDAGKVVKMLADDHLETRILLNTAEGYTVDQGFVREYTGGRGQAFAVDVWRLKQLVEKLYKEPAERQRAFLGELVYTLATAAVLTKGDLPVYVLAAKNQYALAA